jgi:hypothetical protein
MANTQAQFGFQHFGYLPGGSADYQLSKYQIQSSYATKIYFGDPVIKSAASPYIRPATAGTATGTAIVGIFYGCQYTPTGGTPTWSPWFPASVAADATAYVIDAPNALFKVAALLTPIPATAIGANVGYSSGAGGTTVGGGFSTYVVDEVVFTTSDQFPFKIVSMYPGIGNGSDTTTNYNWVIVGFNLQTYKTGTAIL